MTKFMVPVGILVLKSGQTGHCPTTHRSDRGCLSWTFRWMKSMRMGLEGHMFHFGRVTFKDVSYTSFPQGFLFTWYAGNPIESILCIFVKAKCSIPSQLNSIKRNMFITLLLLLPETYLRAGHVPAMHVFSRGSSAILQDHHDETCGRF